MILPTWLTRARKTVPHDAAPIGYFRPASKVLVNEDTALNYAAFYAAVRLIAETVASLSFHVHKRLGNGGSDLQFDNHVDRLLHTQTNPEMSSFTFRELLQSWVLSWGNGYAEIERDERGRAVALWPIEPWRVEPGHDESGKVLYAINNLSRPPTVLQARDIFHIKGLSADGLRGYSVVSIAREAIGLGVATERYGAAFFGNSSRPAGVLEVPGKLKPESLARLRESWESVHGGSGNANKTALLEDGVTFKAMAIPPNDAQFLETRRFQIDEIARIFRIPPHLLGSLENATFSNISEQNVEWSRSIIPWAKRWEAESTHKLLGRQALFTKMNLDTLLRGDIKTRYEAYRVGRQWGWLSANDVLRMEDMNPIGKDGDQYLVAQNMTTPEKLENPPKPPAPPQMPEQLPEGQELPEGGEPQDDTPAERMLPVIVDVFDRSIRREVSRVKDAASRMAAADFQQWAATFYPEHAIYVGNSMDAVLSCLPADKRTSLKSAAMEDALSFCDVAVLAQEADDVDAVCAGWLQTRPTRLARELVQLANGVT